MSGQQDVQLTVPATPEFLRVARVTASGLASRLGFSIDEVDDLRLALDELCFTLIGKHGTGGDLVLRYVIGDTDLTIEGSVSNADEQTLILGELSQQILTALVDEHRVTYNDGCGNFTLTKRQGARNS